MKTITISHAGGGLRLGWENLVNSFKNTNSELNMNNRTGCAEYVKGD